jgi:hypothetical protein
MSWCIRSSVGCSGDLARDPRFNVRPERRSRSRDILKTYFQTGDVPTQWSSSRPIDSAVNLIDDRKLIGLKVYDPQLTYLAGDTAVFNRLGVGAIVGEVAEGTAGTPPALEFASWPPLDPNDPGEIDVATDFAGQYGYLGILLEDSLGQVNYGYLHMGMDPAGSAAHPAIHVDYLVWAPEHADHRRRRAQPERRCCSRSGRSGSPVDAALRHSADRSVPRGRPTARSIMVSSI